MTRHRIIGSKALALRLKRRDRPDKPISAGRVRQYADAGEAWTELVAECMGISEEEVRRRLLARHPSVVATEPGPNGTVRVLGLAGVAAEIHSDPYLRRKSGGEGVPGGPLEYAVDFPLIGRRLDDFLADIGVEAEGVHAGREWVYPLESVELFESVERRPRGNPRFAREGDPEPAPKA